MDCSCTDCDACRDAAPANFGRSEDANSFVKKQPINSIEESACQEAKAACPHEAIGDDGGSYDWSAIPPYDMEAAKREGREYLEGLEKELKRKSRWKWWK